MIYSIDFEFPYCRFLYSEEVRLDANTVIPILYASKKYMIPALSQKCSEYLEEQMGTENVCMILDQSILYDELELQIKSKNFIAKHAEKVFSSEGFLALSHQALYQILDYDTLGVKEIRIFDAALAWSQEQCRQLEKENTPENQREILGEALYRIRIPAMTLSEYSNTVSKSGLLDLQEIIDLFHYFTSDARPDIPFDTKPRTYAPFCIKRFSRALKEGGAGPTGRWNYAGRPDMIAIKVNLAVKLAGVGLYGSSTESLAEYKAKIQIKYEDTNCILHDADISYTSDFEKSDQVYSCRLQRPFLLQPEKWYLVIVTISGPKSYWGTDGKPKVAHDDLLVEFKTSGRGTNGTTVDFGQIPDLMFCY